MQSIYKPGGADTRETWFSIATFCTFRPFSLFGSDFQLCKLSWSNSEFCFYPALACLNIQATSNISKFLLGISSSRSPRTAWLLSSVGDYVPCQKFAPAKTYRLWPGKFVNYSLLLSLIITKAHLRVCDIIRVITKRILSICDTMWYIAYWVAISSPLLSPSRSSSPNLLWAEHLGWVNPAIYHQPNAILPTCQM